jgi:hypothetical protein
MASPEKRPSLEHRILSSGVSRRLAALQYRDEQVFHDTPCSLYFQSVEIGNANSRSPKGTVVSWSYNTRPRMNRLPQASASLRKPEKSVAVTVAGNQTIVLGGQTEHGDVYLGEGSADVALQNRAQPFPDGCRRKASKRLLV